MTLVSKDQSLYTLRLRNDKLRVVRASFPVHGEVKDSGLTSQRQRDYKRVTFHLFQPSRDDARDVTDHPSFCPWCRRTQSRPSLSDIPRRNVKTIRGPPFLPPGGVIMSDPFQQSRDRVLKGLWVTLSHSGTITLLPVVPRWTEVSRTTPFPSTRGTNHIPLL